MKDIVDAEFDVREQCITCGSEEFSTLSEGRFADEPLHGFLANDPFGEDPLPYLMNADWRFVQCKNCGQKFHQKILNEEWINTYYSRWISSEAIAEHAKVTGKFGFMANFEKGRHAVERILQLERLTRSLRGNDPVRVLDFGCGEGKFLATAANFGFECVGVEFSAARNKTKLIDFLSNMDQVAENYAQGHFHAAALFQVLEHLTHPLDVLKSIRPFVKDGGVLILETPNCPDVTDIKSMQDYRLIHPLGHINAFAPETQARIAQEAGFKRVDPSVVQCTADPMRAYKREVRRVLRPLVKRDTQQYFVAV